MGVLQWNVASLQHSIKNLSSKKPCVGDICSTKITQGFVGSPNCFGTTHLHSIKNPSSKKPWVGDICSTKITQGFVRSPNCFGTNHLHRLDDTWGVKHVFVGFEPYWGNISTLLNHQTKTTLTWWHHISLRLKFMVCIHIERSIEGHFLVFSFGKN